MTCNGVECSEEFGSNGNPHAAEVAGAEPGGTIKIDRAVIRRVGTSSRYIEKRVIGAQFNRQKRPVDLLRLKGRLLRSRLLWPCLTACRA